MLDAAIKALSQMVSPPFRTVLLKSIGLALVFIVLLALGLHRVLVYFTGAGEGFAEGVFGPNAHMPLLILARMLSVAAALGIIVGSVFLMPAVTALVASFFADEIAAEVERTHYPGDPAGVPVPLARAVIEGVKTALLAVAVYLVALPFLLLAGFGALIFFFATAFLLGREYFELVAMRFHPVAEAKRLRRVHRGTIFLAGMFIAAFVSIPVVNLATPLFGAAFMLHLHKKLARTPAVAQASLVR
jgi:CysZ protein